MFTIEPFTVLLTVQPLIILDGDFHKGLFLSMVMAVICVESDECFLGYIGHLCGE